MTERLPYPGLQGWLDWARVNYDSDLDARTFARDVMIADTLTKVMDPVKLQTAIVSKTILTPGTSSNQ